MGKFKIVKFINELEEKIKKNGNRGRRYFGMLKKEH